MVVVSIETGEVVEGTKKPSPTRQLTGCSIRHSRLLAALSHTLAPRHHLGAGGPVNSGNGTTHADYFYGPIPCTRKMTEQKSTVNMSGKPVTSS